MSLSLVLETGFAQQKNLLLRQKAIHGQLIETFHLRRLDVLTFGTVNQAEHRSRVTARAGGASKNNRPMRRNISRTRIA